LTKFSLRSSVRVVPGLRGLGEHGPALGPQTPSYVDGLRVADCTWRLLGRVELAGVYELTSHGDLLNGRSWLVLAACGRRRRLVGVADLLRRHGRMNLDLGRRGVGRVTRRGDFVDLVRRSSWHGVRLCVEIWKEGRSCWTENACISRKPLPRGKAQYS